MGCTVAISKEIILPSGTEIILTWDKTKEDPNRLHHTKKEYIKVLKDGRYEVCYHIKWRHDTTNTQPLQVTTYRVHKDYGIEAIHQHVTICVNNPVTLKKKLYFEFKSGERVCIGVKNLSLVNFVVMDSHLSLTQR